MPRVTVNKDSLAVTPLPSPTPAPELVQPEPLPDIPLTDQQSDAPPPAEPVQQLPSVQQIIREIKTVQIEVPLCDNPPGLDGTPSFCKAHVNLQLIRSPSATGRNLLHRLWWDLKETGAKLANGRKVFNRNDAVVWLIEQLEERDQSRRRDQSHWIAPRGGSIWFRPERRLQSSVAFAALMASGPLGRERPLVPTGCQCTIWRWFRGKKKESGNGVSRDKISH